MSRSKKRFVFFRIFFSYMYVSSLMLSSGTCMAEGLVNGVFNETWTLVCISKYFYSLFGSTTKKKKKLYISI